MAEIPEGEQWPNIYYNPMVEIRVRNGRVETQNIRTGEWIDCGPLDDIPVHKRRPPPPKPWEKP